MLLLESPPPFLCSGSVLPAFNLRVSNIFCLFVSSGFQLGFFFVFAFVFVFLKTQSLEWIWVWSTNFFCFAFLLDKSKRKLAIKSWKILVRCLLNLQGAHGL